MEGLPSVAFDAVFVPGGAASIKALSTDGVALHYLLEAYKHLKAIALHGEAKQLLDVLRLEADAGLIVGTDAKLFKAFLPRSGSIGFGRGSQRPRRFRLKDFFIE